MDLPGTRERAWLASIVAAGSLLAGCAASVEPHVMPTPAMMKDPRLDFTKNYSASQRSTRLPVFYATTRAPGEPGHFVNAKGDAQLGVAHVRLGDAGWTWDDLVASDRTSTVDKVRRGEVERIEPLGDWRAGTDTAEAERRFIAAIEAQLARTGNREVGIYVHGYRVAFDEVTVQMGSFAHFLSHGAMVTFQWPTGANFWNYLTDCPRAEQYVPDIERLVALVARTSAVGINLLAYSCGSPLLAQALSRLRARHPEEGREALAKRYRIGNVIFAASDVDLKTFAREYMPPILDLTQQLDRLAADPRLQVVDVSDVRGAHEMGGMKGHGYWYANDWISTDITLMLRHPIPPAERCLVNDAQRRRVWRMPDDYPECVANRLLSAYPQLRRDPPR
jgi:esterase/lipase superfamily enzyme